MSHNNQDEDALHLRSSGQLQHPGDHDVHFASEGQGDIGRNTEAYPPRRTGSSDANASNNASGGPAKKSNNEEAKGNTSNKDSKSVKPTVELIKKYVVPVWILPHLKRPRVSYFMRLFCVDGSKQ